MSKDSFIPGVEVSFKRKYSDRLFRLFLKSIAASLADITDEYVAGEKGKNAKPQERKQCR